MHVAHRKRSRRRGAWALALVVALAAGTTVALPTPAEAAVPVSPGKNMVLDSLWEVGTTNTPSVDVNVIDPQSGSGRVQMVLENGQCLTDEWTYKNVGAPGSSIRDRIERPCAADNPAQAFYFIPSEWQLGINENRQFLIVSASTGRCFYSTQNGLGGVGNIAALDPRARDVPVRGFIECGASSYLKPGFFGTPNQIEVKVPAPAQAFNIGNDVQYSDGSWAHWTYILQAAYTQGVYNCANDGGASCLVRLTGTSDWVAASDPAVAESGTFATRLAGCGTALPAGGNVTFFNNSDQPVSQSVSSQISSSRSTEISHTNSITTSVVTKGTIKEVFEIGGSITFSHDGTVANATSETQQSSVSTSVEIPPHRFFMVAWTESVYEMEADWRLGIVGQLNGWETSVASTFPVRFGENSTQVASLNLSETRKTCLAGGASTNVSAPSIAASTAECTDAGTQPLPQAAVGTTLVACPGAWRIPPAVAPAGSADPVFSYQWYYVDSSGNERDIPNATNDEFTLQNESFLTGRSYLGVRVNELGDPYRLEAQAVRAPSTLPLEIAAKRAPEGDFQTLSAAGPVAEAPSFSAERVELTTDEPVTFSLVADADFDGELADGSGLDLEIVGDLPPGLSANEQGDVTGVPTDAGTFEFTATNTIGALVSERFVVIVHGDPADFVDESELSAAVGAPFSHPLVEEAAVNSSFEVTEGNAAHFLSVDAQTGVASGDPGRAGEYVFSVVDSSDPFSLGEDFLIIVKNGETTFEKAALPSATVGEQFSASLASTVGAGAVVGLVADTDLGGLTVNAHTGELTGVPTSAGTYSFSVTDLQTPGAPMQEYALVVDSAPARGGSTIDGSVSEDATGDAANETQSRAATGPLAITGQDATGLWVWAGAGIFAMMLGAGLMVWRRRTRA